MSSRTRMNGVWRMALAVLITCCAGIHTNAAEILYVAGDAQRLTEVDRARVALFQHWGHDVALISAGAHDEPFQNAAALADVVYVAQSVLSAELGAKLRKTPRGVVSEELGVADALGLTISNGEHFMGDTIEIVHEGHVITGPFGGGALRILHEEELLNRAGSVLAPGVAVLADDGVTGAGVFFAVDTGDQLFGGGMAPARRVILPWGPTPESFAGLNEDGRMILRRSIAWAAGYELNGQRLDAGLKAHFTLDFALPDRVVADDGSAHDGDLLRGARIANAGAFGAAAQFDGADDMLVITDPDLTLRSEGAISMWISPDDVHSKQTVLTRAVEGAPGAFLIAIERGRLIAHAPNMRLDGGALSHKLRPGDWRHLVVTYRPDAIALYLDGERICTLVRAMSFYGDSLQSAEPESAALLIGGCPLKWRDPAAAGPACFNGMIDDVRIYARPVRAPEARDLFALRPGPKQGKGRAGEFAGR